MMGMKLRGLPVIRSAFEFVQRVKRAYKFHQRIEQSLKWHHEEHDPKIATSTTPPANEDLRIRSVWITEAYPPSLVNSLINSLKRLGWDKDSRRLSDDASLTDWIRQSRTSGSFSSWNNAGVILRHDDERFPLGDNRHKAKLPDCVDYGYLSIHNATSSLTLITVNFILKDPAASSINTVLKSEYKTKVEHFPSKWRSRSTTYIDVERQKSRDINKAFSEIHHEISAWFHDNLPGHFSKTDLSRFPVADFVTSEKYNYPAERNEVRHTYFEPVLRDMYEAWNCKEFTGLELRPPYHQRSSSALLLFGNLKKLSKDTKGYGNGLLGKVQDYFDHTMALWAIHGLLGSYEHELSTIRDKSSSKPKTVKKTLGDLSYIRNEFLAVSSDVQMIIKGLTDIVENNKTYYESEKLTFLPPEYISKKIPEYPDYFEQVRERDVFRIGQITLLQKLVRDAVVSGGNIASAISNLRIQRYVFWLTIFTAILACISIVTSINSPDKTTSQPSTASHREISKHDQ